MEALPYVVAATPLVGNLAMLRLPVVMLLAFVASVVAELAKPLNGTGGYGNSCIGDPSDTTIAIHSNSRDAAPRPI
jgi:hypothetical protein